MDSTDSTTIDSKLVTYGDDGSASVTLRKPLELETKSGPKRIAHVVLRQPTAGDLEAAMDGGKGEVHRTMRLVVQLSELSMPEVRALAACDYLLLSEVTAELMKSSS